MADPDPQFCPRCGTARIADMPFCPKCGLSVAELAEGAPPRARVSRVPALVIAAIVVAVGLIVFGLLTRFQPVGAPGSGSLLAPNATVAPGAPILGLTILSPTDGQTVVTKEITVIGTAPPGLTITQDISFGFDQHATVDGTGHWAIKAELKEGDNKLTFRIGDDGSTKQTIRVIYTPPQTPSALESTSRTPRHGSRG
jgi:hypothetical protein